MPANEVPHGWAGFVETSTGDGRIKRARVGSSGQKSIAGFGLVSAGDG